MGFKIYDLVFWIKVWDYGFRYKMGWEMMITLFENSLYPILTYRCRKNFHLDHRLPLKPLGREGTPGRHEPPLCRHEPPRVAKQTKPPLCSNEHAQNIKMCLCNTGGFIKLGVLSLNKRFFWRWEVFINYHKS